MTKEERRLLMPYSSAFWDDLVRVFELGGIERFEAREGGEEIRYIARPAAPKKVDQI